jgi:hypothetical protein
MRPINTSSQQRWPTLWIIITGAFVLSIIIAFHLGKRSVKSSDVAISIPAPLASAETPPPQEHSVNWRSLHPGPVPEEQLKTLRKQQITQEGDQRHINETLIKESAYYAPVLFDLGLNTAEVNEIFEKLKRLHKGAMSVNEAIMELGTMRQEYDKMLQNLLGEDNYKRYREFEAQRPVLIEMAELDRHLALEHRRLSEEERAIVLAAFDQFSAITTTTWHGPYDPIPRPLPPHEALPHLQELIASTDRARTEVTTHLKDVLADETLRAIDSYFAHRMDIFNRDLEFAQNPDLLWKEIKEQHFQSIKEMLRLRSSTAQ